MDHYQRREKLLLDILDISEEKEHFHQDIELLYVLSGRLEIYMDDQKTVMSGEDVLIINANKRHYLKGGDGVLYVKLTIMYDLLSDILNQYDLMFICDSERNTDAAYDGLRKLLQQLLGHFLSNKGNVRDFAYISLCYQIMDYLCTHFLIRTADTGELAESDKYQQRLLQIDNYIRANYRSAISLKDLAEKLYLSNGYLSRFFKKNYGMSFADYLTHVRLHHAVDQLLYTDTPITRIVYDNGFASVAIFNKAFKKEYGETPSAVRKRALMKKNADQPVLSGEMEKKLENALWKQTGIREDMASGEISAEISAEHGEPLNRIWSKVINIGSAEDMLRSEVQEHVVILRESLKFQYVRFWNPFSKEMLIDMNNPEHIYNFSRMDSVLDFLIGHDIRPFIELENKPKRVTKTATTSLIYELFENVASIENWCSVVEAFLRHAVSRYGREEVGKWRFELWFDADRVQDDLYILSYSERFKAIQNMIHQYSDAKIGGCGMHGYVKGTEKKSAYIRTFYKKFINSGTAPDFMTLYCYAYDSREENGKIISDPSSDEDFVSHVIENARRDLGELAADRELCLTEWNLTISDRNLMNDSCFKGAYLMKNYIDMLGQTDMAAYFRGTDRVSESYDTDAFLFGGTGLLTRSGIYKPMAFAVYFLNRLYSQYIGKGSNYLATKDGHGNYGIVCHNCRKLSYNYYYVEEDNLDRDHLSKYFEDMDGLMLHLNIRGVENGIYRMKIYRVNDESGSVQSVWREMEFESGFSRDDLHYIQRVCGPKMSMQKVQAGDGCVRIDISMMANEIAYISLIHMEE